MGVEIAWLSFGLTEEVQEGPLCGLESNMIV